MKKIIIFLHIIFGSTLGFAQTISPLNPPFIQGEAITFNYTGGTNSPTDWVGNL